MKYPQCKSIALSDDDQILYNGGFADITVKTSLFGDVQWVDYTHNLGSTQYTVVTANSHGPITYYSNYFRMEDNAGGIFYEGAGVMLW